MAGRRTLITLVIAAALGPAAVRAETGDQGFLAGLISRLLSSRDTTVSIGAVEGALSADATVRDVVISDGTGPWFHLDRVRLVWNRGALFSRRLEIDSLEIGRIELARRPAAGPAEPGTLAEPILRELPLKLEIKAFSLAELALGEPVLGAAAHLTASGAATLGKPAEGLLLAVESRRLDAPGRLEAHLSFVPETEALEVSAKLDEPAGGFLARIARLPGEPAVHFELAGSGTLDAFTAKLALDGGPALGAAGSADLHRDGRARRLNLALDTRLAGVLPPPLGVLFSGAGQLAGDLRFADDGAVELTRLALTAPGARLTADGRSLGPVGPSRVQGRIEVALDDLSRFADPSRRPWRGALAGTLALDGVPDERTMSATVAARATGLGTGLAALDGLSGGEVAASGTARLLPGNGVGFEQLTLGGRFASATLDGSATPEQADIAARIALPDLARADRRLSGRGEVEATLRGPLSHPEVNARIALADGRMLGRPVPRLALEAVLHDPAGALDATVTLAGEVDRKPAAGHLRLTRRPDGTLALEDLDVAVGSVTAKGSVTIDPGQRAAGTLAVNARTLDDLSPLVLTRLAGTLTADLKLAVEGGRQVVRIAARGAGLRAADATITKLDGQGTVTDPLGRPELSGDITATGIVAAGERVPRLHLTAAAGNLALTARVRDTDVEARGRLVTGEAPRLDLSAASVRGNGHRLALAGPATLSLSGDGTIDIRDLNMLADEGRIGVRGKAGRSLDLAVTARGVPLAAAELAMPGLGLAGLLDGEVTLAGPAAAPQGSYRVTVERLTAARLRAAGAPLLDIAAAGRLRGQAAEVDATVAAGPATSLQVRGTLPLPPADKLELTVRGKVDAGLANAALAGGERRLGGIVTVDLRANGPLTRPELSGSAALSEGSYRDPLAGVRLDHLQARIAARGNDLSLDGASATTGNGGTLSARGAVRLDAASGFPGTVHLEGRRAELIADGTTTVVADLALEVTGPLLRRPAVAGHVETVSVDVRVPGALPAKLKPLDGTRHLHASGAAAARIAELDREAAARLAHRQRGAAVTADLNVTVSSPGRVFVRGHGLDAELGGDLTITGTSDHPVVSGAYTTWRGRLDALGTRLDFTRGRLGFTGDLVPDLDFLAETKANDTTIQVAVTGPATRPVFAFTSQPALPQDEVLSRLLFSKASGGLSPFQALQLAQAISEFSNGGDDGFERLRRSLGVDSLDIRTDTGGASVALSRSIGDRVSLGVKAGATPEQSGLSADIDLTRRLRLKNEIDARGGNAIGLGAEWEY